MDNLFFNSWQSLVKTGISAVLAYISILIILRISGKRTLSNLNAFDFIVTIAIGSSFAAISLNPQIPIADGLMLFLCLIGLQYLVTWLSVRVKGMKQITTASPVMLLYKGEILKDEMKNQRITIDELYVAARKQGVSDLSKVDAIVLETTGDLTVVPKLSASPKHSLRDVEEKHHQKISGKN